MLKSSSAFNKFRNSYYIYRLSSQYQWTSPQHAKLVGLSAPIIKLSAGFLSGALLFAALQTLLSSSPSVTAGSLSIYQQRQDMAVLSSHSQLPALPQHVSNISDATQLETDEQEDKNAFLSSQVPSISLTELSAQQKSAALWIAKTYKVAPESIAAIVREAWKLGQKNQIDPTMLLAIVAVESRFNPLAQSPVGAQGLMQVMTKVHSDKYSVFGGIRKAFDPLVNMQVGTKILAEYIKSTKSIETALKHYVGAALHSHDGGYADKVFQRYALLNQAVGIKPRHHRNATPNVDAQARVAETLLQEVESSANNAPSANLPTSSKDVSLTPSPLVLVQDDGHIDTPNHPNLHPILQR